MTNTGYSNGSSTWGIFIGTTATVSGATAEGVPGLVEGRLHFCMTTPASRHHR